MSSLGQRIFVLLLIGSSTAAVASEGGGGSSLLSPQIGTVFWTLVTFLIMVVLLGRYAWKPLLGAVDAREKSIRDSIEQARRDREQAESLVGEQRELLAEARRERAGAIEQGKRDAEQVRAEILEKARKEHAQALAQGKIQIQAEWRRAREELQGSTVDLAIRAGE